MFRIICVVVGYFIGCIQIAYLYGKWVGHMDIREYGSGNAGTTNVARVFGFASGLFVFIADSLKAVLVFFLCEWIAIGMPVAAGALAFSILPGFYGGVGVLLGHNFPVFLKFRGGKGIASSLGLMFCVDWRAGLIALAVGTVFLFIFRYISLFSIVTLTLLPLLLFLFHHPPEPLCIAVFMTVMALLQHRGNISRLIHHSERKFSFITKRDDKDTNL